MELLASAVGPIQTNVYVLADPATREAIAIDTATPCLVWVTNVLVRRGWRLKLIVSTHGHWDHIGDNAALVAWTREQSEHLAHHAAGEGAGDPLGAEAEAGEAGEALIAVHPLDRHRLVHPEPISAPFEIPPSIPAVDLAEGGRIRLGEVELQVLHTPGHTEGSVCLFEPEAGLLFAGDTLFADGWGRTDLPGGSEEQIIESLGRLAGLPDGVRVLPGHGATTTIGRERPMLERVKATGRLPY